MAVRYKFGNEPYSINSEADNFETRRYIKDADVIGGWTQLFFLNNPTRNETGIFAIINAPKNITSLDELTTHPFLENPAPTMDDYCEGTNDYDRPAFPNWGVSEYELFWINKPILTASEIREFYKRGNTLILNPSRNNFEINKNRPWLYTIPFVCSINGVAIQDPQVNEWESWEHVGTIPTNGIATGEIKLFRDGLLIQTVEQLNSSPFAEIINGCPRDTCAVDCGNVVCCYGSDGIAVTSFTK